MDGNANVPERSVQGFRVVRIAGDRIIPITFTYRNASEAVREAWNVSTAYPDARFVLQPVELLLN